MNIDIIKVKSHEKEKRTIKNMIIMLSFTIAMIISSYIKIQLFIVPFTMQTFVVVLSAYVIANRKACISYILYLLYGLAGAAIFANGRWTRVYSQPYFWIYYRIYYNGIFTRKHG